MEFIGIDFGSYKTTISSSKENGKILGDEQGKRSIPTVLELTSPIRKFGNSITGEHEQSINLRCRNFRDNISNPESCKVYMMFMKYLDRLIKNNSKGNPSICISIPAYFKFAERKFLLDIAKCCNMKVERFYNDITAIAMFACLRREKIPEKFAIFDFGHSKTEVGIFSYENFVLTPLFIRSLSVGAQDFDEKLINIILRKYKLEDKKIVRENILRHLEKLKTVLNSSEVANIQIYVNENPVNVQITQEEYIVACKENLDRISKYIDEVIKETEFKGMTEITGGNSSSFLIKNILNDKLEFQVTLDLSESCAIGTALGLACSVVSNKYKMHDILGRNISVKLEGNDQKPAVVFKSTDILNTSKTITYNRKGPFKLEILEDDNIIGNLEIKKENTDEPEAVKIVVEINKFGLFDVKSVKIDSKDLEYQFSTFEMSKESIEELIKTEEKFRVLETNIEKIGHMRNELETMAMSLLDSMSTNFNGLFTSEDEENVRNIAMDLFDIPSSSILEEEEKVRDDVIKQLDFVSKKLETLENNIKEELALMKNQINDCKEKFPKKSTPSYFKLQGMFYKLEEFGKKLRIDLFTASNFDKTPFDKIKENLKEALVKAEAELIKIKQEQEQEINKEEEIDKEETKETKEEETNKEEETKETKEEETKEEEKENK